MERATSIQMYPPDRTTPAPARGVLATAVTLTRVATVGSLAFWALSACSSQSAPLPYTNQQNASGSTAGVTTTEGQGATTTMSTVGGAVSGSSVTSAASTATSTTTAATTTTSTSGGISNTSTGTSGVGGTSGTSTGSETSSTGNTSTGSVSTTTGGGGVETDVAVYDPQNPPMLLDLSGNLSVHDPVVMKQGDTYYMFYTGGQQGINTKTSTDLQSWQSGPTILSPNPSWISGMVPGVANLWAPDISYFAGVYHLYYSASIFAQNRSCIGHATRPSLADNSQWTDQGMVICSNVTSSGDNWNAIDPNVVIDTDGSIWLAFGSFWGGLKLIQLDQTGAPADGELYSIAARPNNEGALEAPFIVIRGGYYYLFMSWDHCCQGTSSTYNIRVARAQSVLGPYEDKAGTPAMEGGGTLLVEGDSTYHGPGHNAVLFVDKQAYNIYHAYPNNGGQLRISELAWDDTGWPISAGP